MERGNKVRLGLVLFLAQVFALYTTLQHNKGKHNEETRLTSNIPNWCGLTPLGPSCFDPFSLLVGHCGRLRSPPLPYSRVERNDEEIEPVQEDEPLHREEPQKVDSATPQVAFHPKEIEKEGSLIYQIIIVLLVVSVTASLADCFQERSRRLANPNVVRAGGLSGFRNESPLNRRMSLADLTMQRHARRESQASYRPPVVEPKESPLTAMGRRSMSQDSPKTGGTPELRQKSLLLRRLSTTDLSEVRDPQDGGWAERRRVRMIHRH